MKSLRQSIESRLTSFILDELLEEDGGESSDGGDPLAADALDSLGLEQVVEYVNEEFGVSIRSEEMVRKNFKSIPALAAFVEVKLAEGAKQ